MLHLTVQKRDIHTRMGQQQLQALLSKPQELPAFSPGAGEWRLL